MDITISGAGERRTILDAADRGRVLRVRKRAIVALRHLAIVRGNTSLHGGGILNRGTLTLTDSLVLHNRSADVDRQDGLGGGILNRGTMTLTSSVVRDSSAHAAGGTRDATSSVTGNTPDDCYGTDAC